MPPRTQESIPASHRVLGLVFLFVVVATVSYTHQLIVPIFLGLFAWGKLWLKALSPKLGVLLFKNGFVLQLRRLALQASTHVFVKSHRPWRRRLARFRAMVVEGLSRAFEGYMGLPLWLRTFLAIVVLVTTAGSSLAVFALLIIPQPIIDWLGARLRMLLSRFGVTRIFTTLWELAVPPSVRHRWYMYLKWTLGRRQLRAVARLRESTWQSARGD